MNSSIKRKEWHFDWYFERTRTLNWTVATETSVYFSWWRNMRTRTRITRGARRDYWRISLRRIKEYTVRNNNRKGCHSNGKTDKGKSNKGKSNKGKSKRGRIYGSHIFWGRSSSSNRIKRRRKLIKRRKLRLRRRTAVMTMMMTLWVRIGV